MAYIFTGESFVEDFETIETNETDERRSYSNRLRYCWHRDWLCWQSV